MDEPVASTTTSLKRSRDQQQQQDPWESPEAKRFREDLLLDILDDEETGADPGSDDASADLADVMRSFEEEIAASVSPPSAGSSAFSDYAEPDVQQQKAQQLGFLLEASDDELGLPPAAADDEQNQHHPVGVTNEAGVSPDEPATGDNYWGFQDQDGVLTLPLPAGEEGWQASATLLDAMATLDAAFPDDFGDVYLSWASDLPDFSLVA